MPFDPFGLAQFGRQFQAILNALDRLAKGQRIMADELATLQAAVSKANTSIDSAVSLLNDLKAKLDAAGTDPAALAALSASLGAETDKLTAAVIADAPAAPAPAPSAGDGDAA